MSEAALRSWARRDALASIPALQAPADGVVLEQGWVLGKPFRIAHTGPVFDRETGKSRLLRPLTREDLQDCLRVFAAHRPNLDLDHRETMPGGAVVAMAIVDDGEALAVLPAYGPKLGAYVDLCNGAIWSSPVISWRPYHHPATGEVVGSCWIKSVAITADPASLHAHLDPVSLTANAPVEVRGEALLMSADEPDALAPISPPEQHDAEKRTMDEEMKAAFAMLIERFDRIESMLKPAEDTEMAAEGEGEEKPEQEAAMAALSAENSKLKCDLLVTRLTANGKVAPAEIDTVRQLFASAGADMVERVYGSRPVNGAVPAVVGHARLTANQVEHDADRAAKARKYAEANKVSFTAALTAVAAEQE